VSHDSSTALPAASYAVRPAVRRETGRSGCQRSVVC